MQTRDSRNLTTHWIEALIDYLKTPIPSPATPTGRLKTHLLNALLFAVISFGVILFLAKTSLIGLIIFIAGAAKSGVIFGASIYVADEWLVPIFFRKWGAFPERTVGKIWVIWLLGFFLGCGVFFGLGFALEQFLHALVDEPLHQTPQFSGIELFVRMIPFGILVIFVVIHLRLKRQLAREMERMLQVNRIIRDRQADMTGNALNPHRVEPITETPFANGLTPPRKFVVSSADATEAIDFEAISHITIEEHYVRIFVRQDKDYREIQVKISLKETLAQLPLDQFVQTHRSHVINLAHVSRIQRVSRTYEVSIGDDEFRLPVSRHRIGQVIPSLQAFWKPLPSV